MPYQCRYFVARTPLLTEEDRVAFSEGCTAQAHLASDDLAGALDRDRALLRARLRRLVEQPTVREALAIASPSLARSLEAWTQEPTSAWGQKIEKALYRYFARMSGRATPFGLFSGLSIGSVGDTTCLQLGARTAYQRYTRLDSGYLFRITRTVAQDPEIRRTLVYRPNSSLHRQGDRLHYVSTVGYANSYGFESVEITHYLLAVLERARGGAILPALVESLTSFDPEIRSEEAAEFLDELIESQILTDNLSPPVTGEEPASWLLRALEEISPAIAEKLAAEIQAIRQLDSAPLGSRLDLYAMLGGLHETAKEAESSTEDDDNFSDRPRVSGHVVQVDMRKPAPGLSLSRSVVADITESVGALARLTPRPADSFRGFREEFLRRYGAKRVPLTQVLDQEIGIEENEERGAGVIDHPLLDGLRFTAASAPTRANLDARHTYMLQRLSELQAEGRAEWVLDAADHEALAVADPAPLPESFCVFVSLCARSQQEIERGHYRSALRGAIGPSSANVFGRFAHGDPQLHALIEEDLRLEERAHPEALFAEIVHLPRERLANVIVRPLLRQWEIPYLGVSGAPFERQLPIADLDVSIVNDRVVLSSRAHGKEVIPRLTSAHNFRSATSLSTYRFLCGLMHQGVQHQLGWQWGPLVHLRHLPRVVLGRCIVSPEFWTLSRKDLVDLRQATDRASAYRSVQALRERFGLPRVLGLAEGDNVLTLDLENVLSVDVLLATAKNSERLFLTERLPETEEMCVTGTEGHFVAELQLPLVREEHPRQHNSEAQHPNSTARRARSASETFTIRDNDWVTARLWCTRAGGDQLLVELVHPLLQDLVAGQVSRWYFVRPSDDRSPLQIALRPRTNDFTEILRALHRASTSWLDTGVLQRLQIVEGERPWNPEDQEPPLPVATERVANATT